MFLAAIGTNFDAVGRDLLALFMKNGNDVRGRATAQTGEEQFQGTGRGSPSVLDVHGLGVAAGSGGDKELVSGVLNDRGNVAHQSINNTRYTVGFMPDALTLSKIQNARQRIAPCIRRTPLTPSSSLSERFKTNVYVKLELFQKTGSFKVRGAFNKALSLKPEERGQGIVAVSGGNHAQAVGYAARTLGLRAVILMPEATPNNYVEATRGYGAEVKFAPDVEAAFAEVAEYQRQGWAYIHPFDDLAVMAGQGTIGLEILDDRRRRADQRHRDRGANAQAGGSRVGRRDRGRGLHVEIAGRG